MKRVAIEWSANIALADVAAQAFANARTSKYPEDTPNLRWIMRHWSVEALRFLWKNGDAQNRASIAARVQIWMRAKQSSDAILAREKDRLAPGYAKRQKRAAEARIDAEVIRLREVEKLTDIGIAEKMQKPGGDMVKRAWARTRYKLAKRRAGYVMDDQEPTGWRKAML